MSALDFGRIDYLRDLNCNTSIPLQMADGKLNGQKAFMSGKLKVKGNIMLATSELCYAKSLARSITRANVEPPPPLSELDGVLKAQKAKM